MSPRHRHIPVRIVVSGLVLFQLKSPQEDPVTVGECAGESLE